MENIILIFKRILFMIITLILVPFNLVEFTIRMWICILVIMPYIWIFKGITFQNYFKYDNITNYSFITKFNLFIKNKIGI
jgi:hypothetical protein